MIVLLLMCSCISKNTDRAGAYTGKPVTGIFTTYIPDYIERFKIEKTFKGRLDPLPLVLVYLRPDGIYVMGYCDNQISEAGRYVVAGDSIGLYDRHNFDERMYHKAAYLVYDRKDEHLYAVITAPDEQERHFHRLLMGRTPHQIISMKRNATSHYGFLRGQDMSFDSIVHYYEQYPIEKQNLWSDSTRAALHRK